MRCDFHEMCDCSWSLSFDVISECLFLALIQVCPVEEETQRVEHRISSMSVLIWAALLSSVTCSSADISLYLLLSNLLIQLIFNNLLTFAYKTVS